MALKNADLSRAAISRKTEFQITGLDDVKANELKAKLGKTKEKSKASSDTNSSVKENTGSKDSSEGNKIASSSSLQKQVEKGQATKYVEIVDNLMFPDKSPVFILRTENL